MKKVISSNLYCTGLVLSLFIQTAILQAQSFTVSTLITQNISCNGSSDGSLTATVNPPGSTYTYLWSNGATTPTISNLSGGAYSVQVQDVTGGNAVATVVLPEPAPFVLSSLTELPTQAVPMVLVDIETEGGTAPYNYVWTDESDNMFSLDEDLFNAPAGVYTLNATDQHGCTAMLTPVTLTQATAVSDAAQSGFAVFPNPVSQQLNLELPESNTALLQVFNASGQLILTKELFEKQQVINVSSWPAGQYALVLYQANNSIVYKILVQH
jgi:hypothetical protein